MVSWINDGPYRGHHRIALWDGFTHLKELRQILGVTTVLRAYVMTGPLRAVFVVDTEPTGERLSKLAQHFEGGVQVETFSPLVWRISVHHPSRGLIKWPKRP